MTSTQIAVLQRVRVEEREECSAAAPSQQILDRGFCAYRVLGRPNRRGKAVQTAAHLKLRRIRNR